MKSKIALLIIYNHRFDRNIPILENFLKDNPIGAIFESDIPVDIHVDDSNSYWYVLEISDTDGNHKLVTSEDADDGEDYYYNDYDSDDEDDKYDW